MGAQPRPPLTWGPAVSTVRALSFSTFGTRMHRTPSRGAQATDILSPMTCARTAEMNDRNRMMMTPIMSEPDKRDGDGGPATGVVVKPRPKTKKPAMYKVLMLNDDYTPMEFVVHVLERFFQKNRDEATRIMMHVHRRGVGVCGVYTYEVAETKVTQVMDLARQNQHPLQCTIEKE